MVPCKRCGRLNCMGLIISSSPSRSNRLLHTRPSSKIERKARKGRVHRAKISALDSDQDSVYEELHRNVNIRKSNAIQVKGKLKQLLGFWKSWFAGNHIAHCPIPMPNRSPHSDRPDLIAASHPRAKLPCTESILYLRETIYNLVHSRAFLRIFLDHIGDQCFHEFEAMVLLMYMIQSGLNRNRIEVQTCI